MTASSLPAVVGMVTGLGIGAAVLICGRRGRESASSTGVGVGCGVSGRVGRVAAT